MPKPKRTLNAMTFGRKEQEVLSEIPESFREYVRDRANSDLAEMICQGYFSPEPDDGQDEYYFRRLIKYRDELAPIISRYTIEVLTPNKF